MGNASFMKDKVSADSPMVQMIHGILMAADKAKLLSLQLLSYSGKGKLLEKSIDLNKLVREIDEILRISTKANIKFNYKLSNKSLWVMGDVSQLHQVVLNLVTNATEAFDDNSQSMNQEITLLSGERLLNAEEIDELHLHSSMEQGKYVYFTVKDNGQGIENEVLEHIFDPLFSTKDKGHGLGLSSVHGIVHRHLVELISRYKSWLRNRDNCLVAFW